MFETWTRNWATWDGPFPKEIVFDVDVVTKAIAPQNRLC